MNNAVIEFQDVHKGFGSQKVLRGLSISVPRGKVTFAIGRSGEGKSVTLKHIVGILSPDSGRVRVLGQDMTEADEKAWLETRKKIGYLFQDGALFDSISVGENVAFALEEFSKQGKKEKESRVQELLELVGLPDAAKKFPTELSIGEKKRVGLARALALKPEILLYDEPTTGMDSFVAELIDDLITSMQKRLPGLSAIVVSHDVKSILSVAEHIIFLHEGKAYFEGDSEDFKNSSDPLVRQFIAGSSTGPLAKVIG